MAERDRPMGIEPPWTFDKLERLMPPTSGTLRNEDPHLTLDWPDRPPQDLRPLREIFAVDDVTRSRLIPPSDPNMN